MVDIFVCLFIYLIMFNIAGWYKVILLFKELIYIGLVSKKRLLESNKIFLFFLTISINCNVFF